MLVFEGLPRALPMRTETWLAFGYHVLFAQALAYLVWFEMVSRVSAGAASLGTLMVPAVGFLSAMAILGERPSWTDGFGLVLVVAAAATVMRPR